VHALGTQLVQAMRGSRIDEHEGGEPLASETIWRCSLFTIVKQLDEDHASHFTNCIMNGLVDRSFTARNCLDGHSLQRQIDSLLEHFLRTTKRKTRGGSAESRKTNCLQARDWPRNRILEDFLVCQRCHFGEGKQGLDVTWVCQK
jgi:hypothetical protein